MTQREQAELFRSNHRSPPVLVLPNVWDVASAVVVARTPGARAIATTSAGVAWSRGYPDGEVISRDEMLEEVRRIAAAVELPVTADLEGGYGDPAETARLAVEAGAVGLNLEDGIGHEELRPVAEQVDAIRSVVAAGAEAGVPLVVNARTDSFLLEAGTPEEQLETTIERLNAYLEAGADCGYAIGARDPVAIARLTSEIPRTRQHVRLAGVADCPRAGTAWRGPGQRRDRRRPSGVRARRSDRGGALHVRYLRAPCAGDGAAEPEPAAGLKRQ